MNVKSKTTMMSFKSSEFRRISHDAYVIEQWDGLIELRFHIDTKQAILETFFTANLLTQYWRKLNRTQQKQTT